MLAQWNVRAERARRRRHVLENFLAKGCATALLIGSLGGGATALADFPTSMPASGSTISSNGNGVTPINAPNSTDVTLNIDGEILTPTSPAINLGGGATINVLANASVEAQPMGFMGSLDLPDIFAPGIVDEATLNAALLPRIGLDSTFASFNTPLIQLGTGGTTGFSTVNIGTDGLIGSIGSEGILGLSGGDNRINLDGGVLVTAANNSAAYRTAGSGDVTLTLTNSSAIATLFNGSPAIDFGGPGSTFTLTHNDPDSTIFTLGNNAAAIQGIATNSTMLLTLNGHNGRLPKLGTFGNNSSAILFHGDGNSTGSITIGNVGSNALVPACERWVTTLHSLISIRRLWAKASSISIYRKVRYQPQGIVRV